MVAARQSSQVILAVLARALTKQMPRFARQNRIQIRVVCLRDKTLPAHGEVFAIYVLAEYQGRKIGYELMNAALDKLSDYKKIALWVLKGNDRAIHFYERYGFRFDGTESEIVLGTPNTEIRMIYERK